MSNPVMPKAFVDGLPNSKVICVRTPPRTGSPVMIEKVGGLTLLASTGLGLNTAKNIARSMRKAVMVPALNFVGR